MKNFLILGKTGAGKSSFINSVFGSSIAETSSDEACTKIVNHYAFNNDYGEICLIDTPGLAEDTIELDYYYLNMIKNAIKNKNIFRVVFVTPLYDTRFRPAEKLTIKLITETFGTNIWNHSWLVFTFAGLIEKEKLSSVTTSKINFFNSYIKEVSNGNFVGYEKIIQIDNKIINWHENAIPIIKVFK